MEQVVDPVTGLLLDAIAGMTCGVLLEPSGPDPLAGEPDCTHRRRQG